MSRMGAGAEVRGAGRREVGLRTGKRVQAPLPLADGVAPLVVDWWCSGQRFQSPFFGLLAVDYFAAYDGHLGSDVADVGFGDGEVITVEDYEVA